MPFPGFSRGVPIVGQRPPEPPPGRYFYQVAVFVMRTGEPLSAESLEVQMAKPLDGFGYKALTPMIVKSLQEKAPEQPAPRVVIVNVWELGFITQEAIERAQEQARAGAGDPFGHLFGGAPGANGGEQAS